MMYLVGFSFSEGFREVFSDFQRFVLHFPPRSRPNFNTPPEKREPGLPPYVPELALPQEMILNYNQTIARPRGVAVAPTGLESTSVVFVYGLDVYCTRLVTSKIFDFTAPLF